MAFIELSNLDKTFLGGKSNQVDALSNINLKVEKGEFLGIVGKSGAGKSSLLHILGCLSKPTKGQYFLNDRLVAFDNNKELAELRNAVFGTVLQEFGLIKYRNVLDNVSVPLLFNSNIKKKEMRKLCFEALEKVDMVSYSRREAWSLSGGEKQRAAIARAIVNHPQIVLADEPTGALDHYNTRIIMEIFKKLNQQGVTIILVTHDLDIAGQCKRVITVSDGRIVSE